MRMNKSPLKSWVWLILCYWLFMSTIFFLEFRYMASDWAGLLGFLLTLPLSALIIAGYLLVNCLAEFRGYGLHITDHHAELGFVICAFVNAFILYPFYLLCRKERKEFVPPPPPNNGMHPTPN